MYDSTAVDEDRIAWLEHILSDPDVRRFYTAEQCQALAKELGILKAVA